MTLLVCLDCTTAFAVGAPRCPHCGSERSAEEGTAAALGLHARGRMEEESMPKITVHGGPSDRHAVEAPTDGTPSKPITGDGSGTALPPVEEAGEGEQPSAGSNSETSSEKPQTSSATNAPAPQKRARTTGSRSPKAKEASSTASSTATSGPETDAADAGGEESP